MTPLIRPSEPADLEAIQAIYAHHVLNGTASFETVPPDRAELGRRREDVLAHGLPHLVALQDGAVTGYAYAGLYRTRAAYRFTAEDSIYVAPDQVGQGIGRALLAEVLARTARAGFRQMVAVIGDSDNAASIGLHAAMGFQRSGLLVAVGFKFGRWIDSVLMQRSLGTGNRTAPRETGSGTGG